MQIRKWLALLVSAALALSLLAGCGGKNQSLGQVILDLLDGQYQNVTVQLDPDLEADLRQAVHEGETDAEIRAALEKILGSGVSFRLIGDGQQGDTAWNLILYPGSDPDAAARSAFTEWSKVFGSLPRDGQYSAGLAMIETENGYAILVKATVDKAASRDDDDDDDDDDEPEKPYSVEIEGGTLKSVTVDADAGFRYVLFGESSSASEDEEEKALAAAREKGFEGVTIELAAGSYSVDSTFTTPFKGTLQGESETNKATITLTGGNGLFKQIESHGKVENITFEVQTDVSNTYSDGGTTTAGAVAGQNKGTIQNCDVTINAGGSITADGDGSGDVYAGGIVGTNESGHEISGCKVTINGGSITATNGSSDVYAGGIAGENHGTISNCDVEGSYSSDSSATADISVANADYSFTTYAGGIAGCNQGTVDKYCSVSCCKIKAGDYGDRIAAGCIVGWNDSDKMNCGPATGCYITAVAGDKGSATVPNDFGLTAIVDQGTGACAGAKIGYDDDTSYPVG